MSAVLAPRSFGIRINEQSWAYHLYSVEGVTDPDTLASRLNADRPHGTKDLLTGEQAMDLVRAERGRIFPRGRA